MSNFHELINSGKPVLVDFYADWCQPCKMMSPILSDVKNAIGDDAYIIKVDIDASPEAAAVFKVHSVPTLIIFKDGRAVWRQAGVVPANILENQLRQHL